MLTIPILDKLRSLRLYGLLKSYQEQTQSSEYADLSFEERFGLMVDREQTEQENKRLNSRLRRAKLRHQACMENIDYRSPRGLDKSLMKQLSTGQWIKERLNILITGPCGSGKSFIACALAQRACLEGYSVLYVRAPRLFPGL
jgi:DNA replication protein DnaC